MGVDVVTAITLLELTVAKLETDPIAHEDLARLHGLLARAGHLILASHHRGCDPCRRETINGLYRAWRQAEQAQASVEAIHVQRPDGKA
jgi:hypothetical protein